MESTFSPPGPPVIARAAAVLVGRRGRRYVLGHAPIGAGSQAEVWPAERDDGHAVAIKLARPGRAACDALDAEGRWLEALTEGGADCALPCFDHVDWDGRPGLVLPRLPRHVGDLVRLRVDAAGERALEAVLGVAAQLARALGGLHRARLGTGHLVHRDVKPENVLVDAFGAIHLADLGGSLLARGNGPRELGVFGSPLWAPPEQLLPGIAEPSPTWDTYAACGMVHAWLAGAPPSFQLDPTPRLTARGREVHRALRALADAGPAERPAAADALLRAREGLRAADVVAADAPLGLPARDRAALAKGVAALAEPGGYGDDALEDAVADLAHALGRGLSPHAGPAPDHRWADGAELGEAFARVAGTLAAARRRRALGVPVLPVRVQRHPAPRPAHPVPPATPERPPLVGTTWGSVVGFAGVLGALGGMVWARVAEVSTPIVAPAEVPPDRVRVGAVRGQGEPFRIGRTEVSTRAWRACVAAGRCDAIPPGAGLDLLDGERQPAVGVSYHAAEAWCAWDGGRLPTEAEWERAAFGAERGPLRRWPWGETPLDCTKANVGICGLGLTAAVDAFPSGTSAWGAVQMVGNAWEWTATRAPGGTRVLRGGAFDTSNPDLDAGARRRDDPDRALSNYGFRCVYPE